MDLSDEPIMSSNRDTYDAESHIVALFVKIATNTLTVAPNYWLA